MNLLFLSHNPISKPLFKWLSRTHAVTCMDEPLTPELVKKHKPDWIISYNYRHLIKPDVIALMPSRILNLHISYLPWNRGVHPNLWSFVENTPKGVSIHLIDSGVDTGPIFAQKQVDVTPEMSVRESYELLHKELQKLFKEVWEEIASGERSAVSQDGEGSKHTLEGSKIFEDILAKTGYEIPVSAFLEEYGKR